MCVKFEDLNFGPYLSTHKNFVFVECQSDSRLFKTDKFGP